ncbi:MAG: porphobilinogen synthase [Gemmatimonadaceae bacterium]|nr:porphobilinogen synthase [Gemmatimonadaceae bacterium]MDQ3518026.1 porphobilinogen synthase [Gemmatimonadota bacterium]
MWRPETEQRASERPVLRPRRLRATDTLRRMLRETDLSVNHLVHPMFVAAGSRIERPIASMPGHAQRSVDKFSAEIDEILATRIPAVILFGLPESKDVNGSEAWNPHGPVPMAIAELKRSAPDTVVIADVCLCEYTSHGHCGVLDASQGVDNDATLPLLAQAAVAYAEAGADIVAPSAMMDGQVAAIRWALDAAGHGGVAILAYAAKFASAFYGPFREAAGSAPAFGDRRPYQLDPANRREALREVSLDVDEGADMVMVKPAGPYLDIIRQVRDRTSLPVAAYQVSGEYAMLKAAAERGWIDERRAAMESLVGIRRAGADVIITYYAKEAARWMEDGLRP